MPDVLERCETAAFLHIQSHSKIQKNAGIFPRFLFQRLAMLNFILNHENVFFPTSYTLMEATSIICSRREPPEGLC